MEEQIYFSSDIGRKRRLNEDSGFAGKVNDKKLGIKYLLVVADGMGGHSKGEKASQFAVSFIKDLFLKGGHEKFAKRFEIEAGNRYQYLEGVLENAFFYINNQIKTWGEPGSIGTTLTVALILANKQGESEALIAHIGDSRAYLFYNNQFKQITHDDSLVWELYAAGKISKDDMEKHPSKNVITKAINGEQFNSIQLKKIKIPQNAVLLLCSDGLSGMINDKTIASIITSSKTIEETGETLIKAANKAGGKDNISVALYSNGYFAEKVKKEKNKKFAVIGGSVATLVVLAILAFGAYYFLFNNSKKTTKPQHKKENVATTQISENKNETSTEKENNESKVASNDENEQPKEETNSPEDNLETVTLKFLEPKKQVSPGKISVKINFSGLTPNIDYDFEITPSYYDYRKKKWISLKKRHKKITANDIVDGKINLNKIFNFPDSGKKKVIVKLYRDGEEIPLKNNKYVFTIKKRTNQEKISEKTTKCVKKDFKYSGEFSDVGQKIYTFKNIKISLGKCKGKLKNSNSHYSKIISIVKKTIKTEDLKKNKITIVLENGKEETITYAEIKEKLEENKQKK